MRGSSCSSSHRLCAAYCALAPNEATNGPGTELVRENCSLACLRTAESYTTLSAPMETPAKRAAVTASCPLQSTPIFALVLSYVGCGEHFFIAPVCKRWCKHYRQLPARRVPTADYGSKFITCSAYTTLLKLPVHRSPGSCTRSTAASC
jgi:hypothetical protein